MEATSEDGISTTPYSVMSSPSSENVTSTAHQNELVEEGDIALTTINNEIPISAITSDSEGNIPHTSFYHTTGAIIYLSFTISSLLYAIGSNAIVIIPYVLLQLATSTVAFFLREKHACARWVSGLICAVLLSGYKTAMLLPLYFPSMDDVGKRILFYASSALWECSNAALVVGGQTVLEKYGIICYERAVIKGLIPCQAMFVERGVESLTFKRAVHLGLFLIGGFVFRSILVANESVAGVIASYVVLEAEALAVLTSITVLLFDIPCLLFQVGFDSAYHLTLKIHLNIRVVLPYGAVYFSTSCRQFWNKWSRPAMQFIRRLVYYPLGGSQRPYLSIPLLFFLNGTSHYDVGFALVGDRAEKWWNIVFGILGVVATFEVLTTNFMSDRHGGEEMLPFCFVFVRFVFAHLSLRVAVFVFVHKCLKMSILSFL
mmetsp:Transcript_33661/g.41244  ORF Transcript_33661/g.41244 Transcript_33661/m.41244 type:complete len:431 (-) Transcript_33661:59-1351(-)